MNKFVSLSIPLTASTLTIGTAPVYAANCNLDFSQMFVFGAINSIKIIRQNLT